MRDNLPITKVGIKAPSTFLQVWIKELVSNTWEIHWSRDIGDRTKNMFMSQWPCASFVCAKRKRYMKNTLWIAANDEKLLTKVRKPPIRIMASKTLHESQCVNRCLAVEHKGNHPVNNQWWNVDCWVQGDLPMMKVGPGCMIRQKYHVIMRQIEGMADMQSQDFWGVVETGW